MQESLKEMLGLAEGFEVDCAEPIVVGCNNIETLLKGERR
jgi:hypothetical protein